MDRQCGVSQSRFPQIRASRHGEAMNRKGPYPCKLKKRWTRPSRLASSLQAFSDPVGREELGISQRGLPRAAFPHRPDHKGLFQNMWQDWPSTAHMFRHAGFLERSQSPDSTPRTPRMPCVTSSRFSGSPGLHFLLKKMRLCWQVGQDRVKEEGRQD